MKSYEELFAGYTTVLYTTSVSLGGKRRKLPTRIVFNRMKRKNGWKGKRAWGEGEYCGCYRYVCVSLWYECKRNNSNAMSAPSRNVTLYMHISRLWLCKTLGLSLCLCVLWKEQYSPFDSVVVTMFLLLLSLLLCIGFEYCAVLDHRILCGAMKT